MQWMAEFSNERQKWAKVAHVAVKIAVPLVSRVRWALSRPSPVRESSGNVKRNICDERHRKTTQRSINENKHFDMIDQIENAIY